MKYLTIFQLGDFESATSFNNKKEAVAYINECATAAKTKAFENQENGTFLIEAKTNDDVVHEITATIKPVDTVVKYELTYEKNGQTEETTYYTTRKAVAERAKKILDELGYDASPEENRAGKWSVNNPDQNLVANLNAKLVVMGSEGENVVASYGCADMQAFCKNFDQEVSMLNQAGKTEKAELLKAGRKKGIINLCIGAGIAIVGGLLSLASYNNARPGESYTVYTGIIAVGVIDAVCGIYYIVNPKATLPKDKKKK